MRGQIIQTEFAFVQVRIWNDVDLNGNYRSKLIGFLKDDSGAWWHHMNIIIEKPDGEFMVKVTEEDVYAMLNHAMKAPVIQNISEFK